MQYRELPKETLEEIAAAAEAGQTFTTSGIHINYGESEDRMRGYNDGFDHASAGEPFDAETGAAEGATDIHRNAYRDGYADGYREVQIGGMSWHPALPILARWLADDPANLGHLVRAAMVSVTAANGHPRGDALMALYAELFELLEGTDR